MVDFGNTCALVCRFVLLILLLYGIILSTMVVSSCHFISAVTHDDETHGVGLETFENEGGICEPHNSFVKKNYNGMEMAAKVGGYVAPSCGCVVLLWLVMECCKAGGCWGGKCIPCLLIVAAIVCQGVTFLLFQSELFCSNKDIARCDLGDAGYRSLQCCVVYFFCLILYYCGPTPVPFTPPERVAKTVSRGGNKEKKPKSEPTDGGDYTKEMYEQRRRERKISGQGKSGRKKKEIFNDLDKKDHRKKERGGGDSSSKGSSMMSFDDREDKKKFGKSFENSIVAYDHGQSNKKSNSNKKGGMSGGGKHEPKYDEYVDTDPDGMDWSAYTPDKREAHYDKQRSKKRERKEQRERESRKRESGSNSKRQQQQQQQQRGGQNSDQRRGHRQEQEEYSVISEYNNQGGGGSGNKGYNDSATYNKSPGTSYNDSPGTYNDNSRGSSRKMIGYDDSYRDQQSYRTGDDYEDSYRTGDDPSGYGGGASQYSRGGGGYSEYGESPGGSGRDSRYGESPGGSGRDSRYSRGGGGTGGGGGNRDRGDDYSYAQDSYAQGSYAQDSYAQDTYNDDGGYDDSYYSDNNRGGGGRSSSKSRGSGSRRSKSRDRDRGGRDQGYDDDPSYYDQSYASASYDDRGRGGGYRDDPSFV